MSGVFGYDPVWSWTESDDRLLACLPTDIFEEEEQPIGKRNARKRRGCRGGRNKRRYPRDPTADSDYTS